MARLSKAQICLLGGVSRLHAGRIRSFRWCRAANISPNRNQSRLFLLPNSWLLDACVHDRGLASSVLSLSTMLQMVLHNLVVSQSAYEKVCALWPAQMGKYRPATRNTATIKLRHYR